jgi:hypothetical protein
MFVFSQFGEPREKPQRLRLRLDLFGFGRRAFADDSAWPYDVASTYFN